MMMNLHRCWKISALIFEGLERGRTITHITMMMMMMNLHRCWKISALIFEGLERGRTITHITMMMNFYVCSRTFVFIGKSLV